MASPHDDDQDIADATSRILEVASNPWVAMTAIGLFALAFVGFVVLKLFGVW